MDQFDFNHDKIVLICFECMFSNEDRKVHGLSKRWMTVEETGGCKRRINHLSEVKASEYCIPATCTRTFSSR